MQKDSLSIILGNVDSAVIIISGEVSHVSMETHAVVKATLVRFTAEVARLEYKYKVNLKFDSLFCLLRDSMNNFNFQKLLTLSMSCERLRGRKSSGSRIKLGRKVAFA